MIALKDGEAAATATIQVSIRQHAGLTIPSMADHRQPKIAQLGGVLLMQSRTRSGFYTFHLADREVVQAESVKKVPHTGRFFKSLLRSKGIRAGRLPTGNRTRPTSHPGRAASCQSP